MAIAIYSSHTVLLSDLHSPAGVYARLRMLFPETLLLESNDYLGDRNAHSIMCARPLASFTASGQKVQTTISLDSTKPVLAQLKEFLHSFEFNGDKKAKTRNGLFGFTTYDAVSYFEDIRLKHRAEKPLTPDLHYALYEYVLSFDHLRHTLTIIHNSLTPHENEDSAHLLIRELLFQPLPPQITFCRVGNEEPTVTDEAFLERVKKLQSHIARGDIFQVVPSRRFIQKFKGDDFQVYRALRSINPSPYLFYFDLGSYRLFGSSPEAALLVQNEIAILNPIAGTYKRSGDQTIDVERIDALLKDPKESAEHVMLVDLARNDLSRSCYPVSVKEFKEPQLYSHVIHLVSTVQGTLNTSKDTLDVFADTFPAGTVSGAPKFRAMELIDATEPEARGFYAGAVGFFGFDGSCTHAITIRSFLSKDEQLIYQAGAGVVSNSIPQKELAEIDNKLGALRAAIRNGECHG